MGRPLIGAHPWHGALGAVWSIANAVLAAWMRSHGKNRSELAIAAILRISDKVNSSRSVLSMLPSELPLLDAILGVSWVNAQTLEAFYQYRKFQIELSNLNIVQIRSKCLETGLPSAVIDEAIAAKKHSESFFKAQQENVLTVQNLPGIDTDKLSAELGQSVWESRMNQSLANIWGQIREATEQGAIIPQIQELTEVLKVAMHYDLVKKQLPPTELEPTKSEAYID